MATPLVTQNPSQDPTTLQQPAQQPDAAPPVMPQDATIPGSGEDRTPSAPKPPGEAESLTLSGVQCTEDEKKALLKIIDQYTNEYMPMRRKKIRSVLHARENFVGNQYISFDPQNFQWFDPLDEMLNQTSEEEDLGIYRYVNNVYQMLGLSFVAALCPQVPKARWMPADAEEYADCATAKAGSKAQEIIERQNRIRAMLKLELLDLWTDGCYFKYTRFLVDEARAGLRKVPIKQMVPVQVPDRFICPQCDSMTPANEMAMFTEPRCAQCGYQMTPSDFYPADTMEVPQVTSYQEMPNGMVAQTVYGALNVTVAPYAQQLSSCPMLRLDEETDIAGIRASYSDRWDDITTNASSGNAETEAERAARQYVMNATGGRNNMTSAMLPTLSRTWLQPVAFSKLDDKIMASALSAKFPKGVKVVHLGQVVLETVEERMLDRWTWCGTIEGYGMYPPAVGDAALQVQSQINDVRNIIMEWIDRAACAQQFVNESMIDTRKINGKANLPGTITGVRAKDPTNMQALSNAFYQVQATIDPRVFEWANALMEFAQLVSGVLPQVFGGTQADVKTFSGQRQQLNVAIGRLSLFWEQCSDEHADAAAKAVRCAARNYNEDMLNVISGGPENYRNEYIHIDELQGEVRVTSQVDGGIPSGYAEIRDRLTTMFENAAQNEVLARILDDPTNMKVAFDYLGAPGMVMPGTPLRDKVLQVLDMLVQSAPTQQVSTVAGPMGSQPQQVSVDIPSIAPDPDFDIDDLGTAKQTVKDWANKNWRMSLEPKYQAGWLNMKAYYRMLVTMQSQMEMQQAAQAAAAAGPSGGAGASPGGK
jgi:hypothetical protein